MGRYHKAKRSLLHVAVVEEQIEDVSDLIYERFNVNATDDKDLTPLHLAVELKNARIVKLLLDAGADAHTIAGDDKYNTPLNLAIKSNDQSIVKYFIRAIGDVNVKDNEGSTPLHIAARWGNSKILKLLIDSGADVNAKDVYGITPLFQACESANTNILKLLIAAGAYVNVKGKNGNTALHWSVGSENVNLSRLLIEAGANVNAKNLNEITPVHEVAYWGYLDVFKLLISCGGDVNAKDNKQNTPLHRAVINENIDVLNAILDAGADVNASTCSYHTPLHLAVETGNLNISNILVDAGASLNAKTDKRNTPLHLAAQKVNVGIMELLVNAGAKVNILNLVGDTPLIVFIKSLGSEYCSEHKNYFRKGVRLLIECTDVNISDFYGELVLSYILESDVFESVRKTYYKTIIEHVAVLKMLHQYINRDLFNAIKSEAKYSNYYNDCLEELKKAKSTKIQDCWVTFFDLLIENKTKLVKYAGNPDLIKGFVKCVEEFPLYYSTMHTNLLKGIVGREFFDSAADMLSNYLPIFNPTHLIIKDILDTLSEKDWKKLSQRKRSLE